MTRALQTIPQEPEDSSAEVYTRTRSPARRRRADDDVLPRGPGIDPSKRRYTRATAALAQVLPHRHAIAAMA